MVVILYCSHINSKDNNLSDISIQRLNKVFTLIKLYQHENITLYLTGNQFQYIYAHIYLLDLGILNIKPYIHIKHIFSKNTNEEALNSKKYISNHLNNNEKVIIITSDFHFNRVKYIFNIVYNDHPNLIYKMSMTPDIDGSNLKLIKYEKQALYNLKNKAKL